ncbi:MAG TPA: SLC13 family permease [Chitinophagaceae bacterium]|nr:SLC13 family permease [Chitinophagaceae bacterium]
MDLSLELLLTFGIILLGIILFLKEYFSIDTTAILIMALFIVTGILTPQEGFSGFNNPATITVGCMFVLSAAAFRTGLLNRFTGLLMMAGRRNGYLAIVCLVLFATVMSAFVNVTAVVTLFIPVVLKLSDETGINPGKFLMPLSFGALLGGVCTLVGTSTNILVSSIAETHGFRPFGMFEFSGAAIWLTAAGLIYLFTFGYKLLPGQKQINVQATKRAGAEYISEIRIGHDCPDAGINVADSILVNKYKIKPLAVRKHGNWQDIGEGYTLLENDVVKIVSTPQKLQKLRADRKYWVEAEYRWQPPQSYNSGKKVYEVLLPAGTVYAGKKFSQLVFSLQNKATALALRQRRHSEEEDLADVVLKEGDMLLMLTAEELQDAELFDSRDMVLVSDPLPFNRVKIYKQLLTLAIIAGVISIAALNITSIVVSALVGCLILILTGIINPQEAYLAVQWKVIFLLAGVLSMGAALEKTGGAVLLGEGIFNLLGSYGPQITLSFLFLISFLFTNFMSNNATAALMAPIAISIAQMMEVSERPFLIAVMFASSLSFMTPMSYQTNAIIYAPGNYRFGDYLRVGTPLNIIIWILASFIIPLYFPF